MAIQQLSEEQVRTWTREQKDRWWLENVYRGDMLQLTLRSACVGFVLGGVLSATNLYVGARTGWTLGVGLTSVILSFAMFKVLSRVGMRDMTILENNCTQSIATAAGYMTGPLISGIAAYMWVQNETIPWPKLMVFMVVLSLLGVLVAFPMKRRFINDEQQPFPEGRACGVVLDTLYTADAKVGLFKAKALGIAAGLAGFISFISGESTMKLIQEKWMGLERALVLPHNLDFLYAWMAKTNAEPRIANVTFKQLAINPALDLAMIGAGGLMGIRSASSMLIGAFINFVIVAPLMIKLGEIQPRSGSVEAGDAVFGRAHILNNWSLWWGITIMVVASMVSLFAKPQVFIEAFKGLTGKAKRTTDVLAHIELPSRVSYVGVPIVGGVGVWMAHDWFGVSWWLGALSIPLIIVLTLIAASSTAMTGITPTGSLSKIPQFVFGAADPKHPPTNLMTGVMCVEVASNASNLLMDIKPGYMLGAKPRQQAIGHCIGIIAGALASTPLFYALFLPKYEPGDNIQEKMVSDTFSFPSAVQWKGVSDLVTSIFGEGTGTLLTPSIITSMIIAAVAGLVFEIIRTMSKGRFPISPLAIGLGVVVPPESSFAMFCGAMFFWATHRMYHSKPESTGNLLWIKTHEPICAGIIAGAALVGIGDALVRAFLL
ncbi:MAG: OPT/YSL family transporter [Planctomycetota bacterium]|nr:OPT/YSL family transporter [Planctomycetota bacterium]